MVKAILPLFALAGTPLVAQAPAAPPAAPPVARPAPCAAPEYRQFDFWVGEWDVYPTGRTNQVARSRIERLYNDCVIRENWMPLQGAPGGSLNQYDGASRLWRQTWADGNGSWVEFTGGVSDGAMVLTGQWRGAGGPGRDQLTRLIYTRNADGSVRQLGEVSTDDGKSWGPSFDFTYRRRPRS